MPNGSPPMPDGVPGNLIVGILEVPFFLILMPLGIAAYIKSKSRAIKYTVILFPVVMMLNFLVSILSAVFTHIDYSIFENIYNPFFIFIAFIVCLVGLIVVIRWYLNRRDPIVLCLAISFGLYTLSSLFIFLDYYFVIWRDFYISVIMAIAFFTGPAAYLAGISAMIVALVRPKPRQAIT
jgi:hypothetical protein